MSRFRLLRYTNLLGNDVLRVPDHTRVMDNLYPCFFNQFGRGDMILWQERVWNAIRKTRIRLVMDTNELERCTQCIQTVCNRIKCLACRAIARIYFLTNGFKP